ncbi:Hypothetical predicted protein [Scomber scombrus]
MREQAHDEEEHEDIVAQQCLHIDTEEQETKGDSRDQPQQEKQDETAPDGLILHILYIYLKTPQRSRRLRTQMKRPS